LAFEELGLGIQGFTKEGINTINCQAPPGCIRAQKKFWSSNPG